MHFCCRAPYGARGLKFHRRCDHSVASSRAPYGARGLKFHRDLCTILVNVSRPVWGAWIEIRGNLVMHGQCNVAPRMGRVD